MGHRILLRVITFSLAMVAGVSLVLYVLA